MWTLVALSFEPKELINDLTLDFIFMWSFTRYETLMQYYDNTFREFEALKLIVGLSSLKTEVLLDLCSSKAEWSNQASM